MFNARLIAVSIHSSSSPNAPPTRLVDWTWQSSFAGTCCRCNPAVRESRFRVARVTLKHGCLS